MWQTMVDKPGRHETRFSEVLNTQLLPLGHVGADFQENSASNSLTSLENRAIDFGALLELGSRPSQTVLKYFFSFLSNLSGEDFQRSLRYLNTKVNRSWVSKSLWHLLKFQPVILFHAPVCVERPPFPVLSAAMHACLME